MGHSYNKAAKATNIESPVQWTDQTKHKYCGKIDSGRIGKPNKAQKCDACLQIKAHRAKESQRDTDNRRQDKIAWSAFGYE
ncbi:hypothetical protein SMACR_01565 [Sordaria macrospora]|uniref:WGS project CABT00000000 data, contig 2.4 n=2 Tax=Sordaria macrospora TaxID=5147 RepID=F7VR68_SORMK|nr:uncharacterized protein SMAC_01565 [Sordaria macrospora k-hell]KAA8635328.1 hypothetical protein SMACR_01565 [Sordaria macrospora]KAH7634677.1 hypothetical protein B0T09DRAFT_9964 [Sordaria sp. MPI-SDFR-AT-0083]WPJ58545.1 hypothetical protein SMAC4_01565 [Sordaria macrospora]CCC08001.1 unnamed protein product [Sordaria macrospora k-hell]